MCREFSTLLILLFLTLTPVSYSSEQIPDFGPDCQVTQVLGVKLCVAGLDFTTHAVASEPLPPHREKRQFFLPRCINPQVARTHTTSSGRAPPA